MICGSILSLFSQTAPLVNWHNGKVLGWGNLTKDNNSADKAECVDKNGNIYVATCITRSAFGATNRVLYVGGDSVVIGLTQTAVVLSKFDSTGVLLWKKAGICSNDGSSVAPEAQSVKVSAAGKVYLTFSFKDTITFGSTVLLDNIATPSNKPDIVLMELDAANGDINWSKTIYTEYGGSGQSNDEFTAAIDLNNNGEIVFLLAADSLVFRTYSNTGAQLKSKSYYVNPAYLSIYDFNAAGPNIVLAASLMNGFTLGSATINKNDGETFVAVFDTDGNLKWVKQVKSGAQFTGSGARVYGVTQTASGSVYAVGGFWKTCTVQGSTDSLVTGTKRMSGGDNGEELMYMKFGASGSLEWLKQANGESSHRGRKVITTPNGKLLILTLVGSRTFFIGTDSLPQPGVASGTDRYAILYMDTTASLTWGKRINESGGLSKKGVNLYTDAASNIYFTSGTGVFANVTFPVISPSLEYGFFMFVKSSVLAGVTNPTSVKTVNKQSFANVYPNPVSDVLNIQFDQPLLNTSVTIMDLAGKVVLKSKVENNSVNVEVLQTGLYVMTIETEQGISTHKLIKN